MRIFILGLAYRCGPRAIFKSAGRVIYVELYLADSEHSGKGIPCANANAMPRVLTSPDSAIYRSVAVGIESVLLIDPDEGNRDAC